MPRPEAMAMTANATVSDVLVPCTMPEKTSRPRSSVPKVCAREGGVSGEPTDAKGSVGATMCAASARAMNSSVSVKPKTPPGVLRALLIPNPRVQPHIGEIGHDVRQDYRERHEQKEGEEDRHIPRLDGRKQQLPESRPREDGFNEDRTGEEHSDSSADDCH